MKSSEFCVKQREVQGYTAYGRQVENWTENVADLLNHFEARTKDPVWRGAVNVIKPIKDMIILDVGAGRCWAASAFAQMGCIPIAIDINTDTAVGLKAGSKLMKNLNVYFERVKADCEYLPLRNDSVHVVFAYSSLHHMYDLRKGISEISRVLRSNGVLCAPYEHKRGIFQSDEAFRKRHEAARLGANEHAHTILGYMSALRRFDSMEANIKPTTGQLEALQKQCSIRAKIAKKLMKSKIGKTIVEKVLLTFFYCDIFLYCKKTETKGENR